MGKCNFGFSNLKDLGISVQKIKMKVVVQFSNFSRVPNYVKILSYIEIWKRNGLSEYIAITKLLERKP